MKPSPKILCDLPKVKTQGLEVSTPKVEQHLSVGLWGLCSSVTMKFSDKELGDSYKK